MAAVKAFQGAPFGTQKSRFDVSGIHPQSKTPGTYTQVWYDNKAMTPLRRKLGPGIYAVEVGAFSQNAVESRASGPGWARAYETARMAALPHLLHKDQWEKKRLQAKNLGPGTYNIKDFLETMDERPRSTRGICQTRDRRFRGTATSEVPGPGTYGEGGIPHTIVERKAQTSASTVGLLDAGSSTSRHLPSVGCELGPGTYKMESFTDQLAKKVTSVRGPYDLFTGDRNATIKTGHLAKAGQHNLGPGQYNLKSFLSKWEDDHHNLQGKFGSHCQYPERPSERMHCSSLSQWPRPQSEPGPGHYTARELTRVEGKNLPPFISSAERFDKRARKFFTGQTNPVGPGRYNLQHYVDSQHRNGHRSVFNSKVKRERTSRDNMMQERIRATNLKLEDKTGLTVQTDEDYIRARRVIYAQQ